MILRNYQIALTENIYRAWSQNARNVLAVLPTGTGKTVIVAKIHAEHKGASCVIAHRQELVGQISLALAREKIKHRVIGPVNVIKYVNHIHMTELGRSYYDVNAQCGVAGVDTLTQPRQIKQLQSWLNRVTLWTLDESHHLLKLNKWGKGVSLMPNAKGLGVTASPIRADGKGLGRHVEGLFDTLVVGPPMRSIIEDGYITDYKIYAPTSDIDLTSVPISSATGDYNTTQLRTTFQESKTIVGDIVGEYKKHAAGLLGVTFVPGVQTAVDVAAAYNSANVPAEVVSHKTPDRSRTEILQRFKRREILQLVNVDLFGEGFDLPAIQVVSFARPTESYALYVQQFGRGLRLLLDGVSGCDLTVQAGRLEAIIRSKKPKAIIIDHVGNVMRHRLPDSHRVWTLDKRDRRSTSVPDDTIPVRICIECTAVYERLLKACPECGAVPMPAGRATPEQVDGDLQELDAEALAALRGTVEIVDMSEAEYRAQQEATGALPAWVRNHVRHHTRRQRAQGILRASMAWYGGCVSLMGYDDSETQKRFYYKFGIDVLSAQALGPTEAIELAERINSQF